MKNLVSIVKRASIAAALVALPAISAAQVPKEEGREIVFNGLQNVYPAAFQNHIIEYHLPPFVDEEFGFAGCARVEEDLNVCIPRIAFDYMALPLVDDIWERSDMKDQLNPDVVSYTNFEEAENANDLYIAAVQRAIEICAPNPVEQSTWGRIKALYR